MRFNLRNRPKKEDYSFVEYYFKAVEEWFEGFKKQLHKRKQQSDSTTKVYLHWFIEEILGDE